MFREHRRKRVAIVTGANLADGAPGGTRTYVRGLIRFLDTQGVGVDLLSNGPAGGISESCRILRISPEFVGRTLEFQSRLGRWAKRADLSDVGLLHFQRPDDLWWLRRLRPLPPSICTLHGNQRWSIRRRRGVLQGLVYRYIESRLLDRFREILAVDENTARAYRRWYPSAAPRIHVIPVAVDEGQFHHRRNGVLHDDPDRPPVFLYAGRLSPEKRIHLIIDAVKACPVPGSQLVIAGSGPEETALRERANCSAVRFLGDVSQPGLAHLYEEADALVLASEYEGVPTVALEALASGCPVVAISAEWCSSMPTQVGLILTADGRTLSDGLGKAVALRPSRRSVNLPHQFTWPVVGRAILDVYRRVSPEVLG